MIFEGNDINSEIGEAHSAQVAMLSGELFDHLIGLHRLSKKEKSLLIIAAMLHDIGWTGGQKQHHKRAMEMIYDNPPDGLEPREVAIVANIARYHRKALPRLKHERFASLNETDRQIVEKLSALVRIADGLDRTHSVSVQISRCTISKDKVAIYLNCDSVCSEEMREAKEKADLFENVFGKEVIFNREGIDS